MKSEKLKYRIDIRRSKWGMIVGSFWSDTSEPTWQWWGYVTVYEMRGKRMYKVNSNY
jgi:hypothetical protein